MAGALIFMRPCPVVPLDATGWGDAFTASLFIAPCTRVSPPRAGVHLASCIAARYSGRATSPETVPDAAHLLSVWSMECGIRPSWSSRFFHLASLREENRSATKQENGGLRDEARRRRRRFVNRYLAYGPRSPAFEGTTEINGAPAAR